MEGGGRKKEGETGQGREGRREEEKRKIKESTWNRRGSSAGKDTSLMVRFQSQEPVLFGFFFVFFF